MDSVRRRIARELVAKGITMKEASVQLGKNHAYLQQFIERGIPKKLGEDDRAKLASILDLDEAELGASPKRVHARGDVPQFNIHAGMGDGGLIEVETNGYGDPVYSDHNDGFWSFPQSVKASWRNIAKTYSLPVTGDSMEPTLSSGTIVFVDTSHTNPSPPDIYALDYGDGLMVKRIELVPRSDDVRVISDNDRYATYTMRREDLRIFGRVIAVFKWRG